MLGLAMGDAMGVLLWFLGSGLLPVNNDMVGGVTLSFWIGECEQPKTDGVSEPLIVCLYFIF
jgi:hypothetical protein